MVLTYWCPSSPHRTFCSFFVVLLGCADVDPSTATPPPPSASLSSLDSGTAGPLEAPSSGALSPALSSSTAPSSSALAAAPPARCDSDMVLVEGEYCKAVTQPCKKHHKEFKNSGGNKNVSERCLEYAASRCVSKSRQHLAFCMDTYEYPNRKGAIPQVLTQWTGARAICEKAGKRLCTEAEFNFACEGESMNPYVYGSVRNAETCAIDKPYVYPDRSRQMRTYDDCLTDPVCKAELGRLDQREPAGSRPGCVNWAGVFDLNGNVNEWVDLPGEKPPNRSGLKGGWWGPVRSRCRPTVTFHKENDYGYEVGFRCCKDAR